MKKPCAVAMFLALGMLLVTARPAFAQASAPDGDRRDREKAVPRRFYVSVSGFGDIERFGNDVYDVVNGEAVGVGAGIGTFLTRRWSIEFEAAVPRWIDNTHVETTRGSAGGLTMSRQDTYHLRHRTDSGTIRLAFHPSRRGRVRMAYAAGVAFVRFREEGNVESTYTDQSGTRTSRFSAADSALTLGTTFRIEASIRVSRRMALVPYFDAMAYEVDRAYLGAGLNYASGAGPGAFVFRPGAALRFWF